jgi:hypothetical protein
MLSSSIFFTRKHQADIWLQEMPPSSEQQHNSKVSAWRWGQAGKEHLGAATERLITGAAYSVQVAARQLGSLAEAVRTMCKLCITSS